MENGWIFHSYLVGGFENLDYFSIQLGRIFPTDELIFFRGLVVPPTRLCIPIPYITMG
jgi:hypothetical protein